MILQIKMWRNKINEEQERKIYVKYDDKIADDRK